MPPEAAVHSQSRGTFQVASPTRQREITSARAVAIKSRSIAVQAIWKTARLEGAHCSIVLAESVLDELQLIDAATAHLPNGEYPLSQADMNSAWYRVLMVVMPPGVRSEPNSNSTHQLIETALSTDGKARHIVLHWQGRGTIRITRQTITYV